MRAEHASTYVQCYFLAVDSTDLLSPLTGVSGWSVYWSRNGNAPATQLLSPDIVEIDPDNMPGLYCIRLSDATMTDLDGVDGFDDRTLLNVELVLRISSSGMAAVYRSILIYRAELDFMIDRTLGDKYSFREIVRALASVLWGKWSKSGDLLSYRNLADTKDRIVAEVTPTSRDTAVVQLDEDPD